MLPVTPSPMCKSMKEISFQTRSLEIQLNLLAQQRQTLPCPCCTFTESRWEDTKSGSLRGNSLEMLGTGE